MTRLLNTQVLGNFLKILIAVYIEFYVNTNKKGVLMHNDRIKHVVFTQNNIVAGIATSLIGLFLKSNDISYYSISQVYLYSFSISLEQKIIEKLKQRFHHSQLGGGVYLFIKYYVTRVELFTPTIAKHGISNTMYVESEYHLNLPRHINFGRYLLSNLRKRENEIALENIETNEKLSYKSLVQHAVNYAASLKDIGVKKGDVVAIGAEKRIEIIPTIIAIISIGAKCTTLYSSFSGRADNKHKINITQPKYFICSKSFWLTYNEVLQSFKCIEKIITLDEDFESIVSINSIITQDVDTNNFETEEVQGQTDTALILYSSGTTGMPKGVQLTHLNCVISSLSDEYRDPELQTAFVFGEWIHNYDLFMTFKLLAAGKRIVYFTNATPEAFFQAVEKGRINIAFLVPVFINRIAKVNINVNNNVETLKIIYSRSAPLVSEIIENVRSRFPKLQKIVQGYGMTEAGELTSEIWKINESKPGSVGVASPGYTLKVVDHETRKILGPNERGEICLRSPAFMKGYIGGDPSIYLDEDGFFKTGDLGYYDEDKYFFIVDRLKEMINSRGYKFSPVQLETLLLLHPAVRDAGVVGKPSSDFCEEPTAFVVKQPGSNITEKELFDFIAAEVASYLHLTGGIIFIEEMPRNARGKLLRRHLRDML